MKPGRELDAVIAEKVMGWTRENHYGWNPPKLIWKPPFAYQPLWQEEYLCWAETPPPFSKNVAAAWEVVSKLGNMARPDRERFTVTVYSFDNGAACEFERRVYIGEPDTFESGRCDTAPHAICLAALKAVGAAPGEGEEICK